MGFVFWKERDFFFFFYKIFADVKKYGSSKSYMTSSKKVKTKKKKSKKQLEILIL